MLILILFLLLVGIVTFISYLFLGYRSGKYRWFPNIIMVPRGARKLWKQFPKKGVLSIEKVSLLVDRSVEDINDFCIN